MREFWHWLTTSPYTRHLEQENFELRDTIKRMLNPQWRYLLYGEQISTEKLKQESNKTENVKLRRKSWSTDIRPILEMATTPEFQEQHIKDARIRANEEAING